MKTYKITYKTNDGNIESQKVMAFDEKEAKAQFINVKKIIKVEEL